MLYQWAGAVWRKLPRFVRYTILGIVEPKFLVTAGALVVNEAGHLLLLKHVFHVGSGWGVPGGFIEKGEMPATALERELREEISLSVTDIRLVYARTLRHPQQVELVFACRPTGNVGALSHEIERAEWFAPDALPPLAASQRALIQHALPKALEQVK